MGCLYLHIDYATANMYCINWPCKQWFSFAFSDNVCVYAKKEQEFVGVCVLTQRRIPCKYLFITVNLQILFRHKCSVNLPQSLRFGCFQVLYITYITNQAGGISKKNLPNLFTTRDTLCEDTFEFFRCQHFLISVDSMESYLPCMGRKMQTMW